MMRGSRGRPGAGSEPSLLPGRPGPTGRATVRRWLQLAVMVAGFGLCALVLASAIDLDAGVQASLLGLLLAVLPLGIVVPAFLWLDRFEKEPPRLLVFAFAWGALVASVGALVLNTSSMSVLQQLGQDPTTIGSLVVAPVVEETLKGTAVLLILLFRRREVDGVVDGMVYAGIAAAGFAFAENVLYLGRAFHESGGAGLAVVFFLRGVMGPFAHPLFTVCTGIGLGVAATTTRAAVRVAAPLAGLLAAMLLHSVWNLSTVTGLNGFLTVYVFLQVPIFGGFLLVALWARRREGRLIGQFLLPYADAGWLSHREVHMLARMPERRRARVRARLSGGRRSLRAMEAYQDASSELALLRMRALRERADARAQSWPEGAEQKLLGAVLSSRLVLLEAGAL